jgi:2-succinyl-5-enolpyruvyl-6-hydroxy-3-cyclohexene-1-carboxylate synthase
VIDLALRLCRDLAASLAGLGVKVAALSPGSRNTPLALAFAAEPAFETTVHHDERSAGFFGLGAAKTNEVPSVLICTSGTAPAHYYPAVIEAYHARVPLLVFTADRPPELRGTNAPQTIDQIDLYGGAVKLFHDVGVADDAVVAAAPDLALRAFAAVMDSPAGPVHLNFPFREPLLRGPVPAPSPRLGGVRYTAPQSTLDPSSLGEAAASLSNGRTLLVVGGMLPGDSAAAVAAIGAATGTPVLADPQARRPGSATVSHADQLAAAGFLDQQTPEAVIRIGPVPTSKPIWRWLDETSQPTQIYVDAGPWRDPIGSDWVIRGSAATVLGELGLVSSDPSWLDAWRSADEAAGNAINAALAREAFPNEPSIAMIAYRSAPPHSILYAGSSMPIRDLDAFAGRPRDHLAVLANRGANGIDGLLSAAAGAARAARTRVTVLGGDIATLHDVGALSFIGREEIPVTIVVVNNDGGGIFHFLPQASDRHVPFPIFEELFGTPHGLDFSRIASAFGVPSRRVEDPDELSKLIAEPGTGPLLIELRTDRQSNVGVHLRIRDAVRAALG